MRHHHLGVGPKGVGWMEAEIVPASELAKTVMIG